MHLGKPISTLVGPTDAGKSAIIRALRWLCLNTDYDKSFIRRGAKAVSVTIIVGKHRITRRRGKRDNAYYLDGKKYVAMGQGKVPEAISKILRTSPDHFAEQFDPPYWFLKSPGQVSKELNAVVDLSLIDEVQSIAAAKVRKANASVELSKERLLEARAEKKRLADNKQFSTDTNNVLRFLRQICDLTHFVSEMRLAMLELDKTRENAEIARGIAIDFKQLEQSYERLETARNDCLGLRHDLEAIATAKGILWQLKEKQTTIKKKLKSLVGTKCPTCGTEITQSSLS